MNTPTLLPMRKPLKQRPLNTEWITPPVNYFPSSASLSPSLEMLAPKGNLSVQFAGVHSPQPGGLAKFFEIRPRACAFRGHDFIKSTTGENPAGLRIFSGHKRLAEAFREADSIRFPVKVKTGETRFPFINLSRFYNEKREQPRRDLEQDSIHFKVSVKPTNGGYYFGQSIAKMATIFAGRILFWSDKILSLHSTPLHGSLRCQENE